jgi:hypothetical protein
VEKSNSIYTKRISWIHEKSLTPLQVELFQKNKSTPVKRLKAKKLKKIQGIWTILQSTMYDLKKGNTTRLATGKVEYDIGLSEDLFSKRGLSDSGLLK